MPRTRSRVRRLAPKAPSSDIEIIEDVDFNQDEGYESAAPSDNGDDAAVKEEAVDDEAMEVEEPSDDDVDENGNLKALIDDGEEYDEDGEEEMDVDEEVVEEEVDDEGGEDEDEEEAEEQVEEKSSRCVYCFVHSCSSVSNGNSSSPLPTKISGLIKKKRYVHIFDRHPCLRTLGVAACRMNVTGCHLHYSIGCSKRFPAHLTGWCAYAQFSTAVNLSDAEDMPATKRCASRTIPVLCSEIDTARRTTDAAKPAQTIKAVGHTSKVTLTMRKDTKEQEAAPKKVVTRKPRLVHVVDGGEKVSLAFSRLDIAVIDVLSDHQRQGGRQGYGCEGQEGQEGRQSRPHEQG